MKVLIFGATGPSGKLVTEQALAAGHEVTVYVRNPSKVAAGAPQLKVIQGELTDTEAITEAIVGQDAVVSLLGPAGKSTGMPYSTGMGEIVRAMHRAGVRRLIATATPSAADPRDRFSLSFRLAIALIKRFAGTSYEDIVAMAQVIRQSDLDWTIVRLPWLDSKPSDRPVNVGYLGDRGIRLFFLSRDRLARFVVGQLADGRWIRQAPVISNT